MHREWTKSGEDHVKSNVDEDEVASNSSKETLKSVEVLQIQLFPNAKTVQTNTTTIAEAAFGGWKKAAVSETRGTEIECKMRICPL